MVCIQESLLLIVLVRFVWNSSCDLGLIPSSQTQCSMLYKAMQQPACSVGNRFHLARRASVRLVKIDGQVCIKKYPDVGIGGDPF